MGNIYYDAEILDQAEKYYRQALKLEHNNPNFLGSLALLLIDHDINVDEGMELLQRALEINPNNGGYIHIQGWGYYKQGKYEKALDLYKQYADQFPDEPGSFTPIGELYESLGDLENAKVNYKKALIIDPQNIRILISLARIESKLGNFSQALEQYEDVLKLCKTPRQRYNVFIALMNYYELRGQLNEAFEYL